MCILGNWTLASNMIESRISDGVAGAMKISMTIEVRPAPDISEASGKSTNGGPHTVGLNIRKLVIKLLNKICSCPLAFANILL